MPVMARGCVDTADPVDPRAALLAAVTPELAAQIDADGHFLLPEMVETNPHLGPEETQALAVILPRSHADDRHRGRGLCDQSSLDSVGVFGSPAFGPRGDEFLWRGLPLDWQSGVSVTPETAAMLIAKQTGRLVDRVPRLVVPRVPTGLPFDAKWAAHREQPVTVAGTDTAATWTTDELHVGNEWITASSNVTRAVMAADPAQPATVAIRIPAAPYTDRAKAAEYYQKYIDLRREADPVLQPQVAEVKKKLAGVAGEKK